MNQTAANAIAFLMGMGMTKDIATGIVAVLMVESSLNPTAENNTGTETPGAINPTGSYGLAQWNGPRQQTLMAYASAKGLQYSAMNTQLAFVISEIANSYPKVAALIWPNGLGQPVGPVTYQNFIPTFVQSYENPANPSAETASALANAATFYAYSTTPTVAAPTPVSVPVSASAATSTSAPSPTTGATMSALATALAPILESLLAAFAQALSQQLSGATSAGTAGGATASTPAPSGTQVVTTDLGTIAQSVASVIIPQLTTTLQSIVQAELAKVVGAIPTSTTGTKS